MKKLFKELILSFHSSDLPELTRRDIVLPSFPERVRKPMVFIGMRRAGKTYTLFQIMQDLLVQGLDITKILYINFDDNELSYLDDRHLEAMYKAYFELYPEYVGRSDVHFFFDEIHEVEGWEKFVRKLLDKEKMHIYITGSSSKALSTEIATSLRGRTYSQEIFPFSFGETLDLMNVTLPKAFGSKAKLQVMHHLRNYLRDGGFPEVIGVSANLHRSILQEYTRAVVFQDIVERHGVRNVRVLRYLLTHCLKNAATPMSVNKVYNMLRSKGEKIGKHSLYDFMGYFEDAYCIFSVPKYDWCYQKSDSIKKVYPVDQGLITSFSLKGAFEIGAQLETVVFAHLRKMTRDVFYYRSPSEKEVDFVVYLPDQTLHLYQVSVHLNEEKTRKREINSLMAAMKELSLDEGFIVTLEHEETIKMDGCVIRIVPVWKLLLGLVDQEDQAYKFPQKKEHYATY